MYWSTLEIIRVCLLVVLAVGLHQLIRHFGKQYVVDIFETTPQVGQSFVVLADCAYYLIFAAYVLFNIQFERPQRFDAQGNPAGFRWEELVGAAQLQDSVASIGGICLVIGILHGLNVFVLPFVGSVLAFRAKLLQRPSQ